MSDRKISRGTQPAEFHDAGFSCRGTARRARAAYFRAAAHILRAAAETFGVRELACPERSRRAPALFSIRAPLRLVKEGK